MYLKLFSEHFLSHQRLALQFIYLLLFEKPLNKGNVTKLDMVVKVTEINTDYSF